MALRREEKSCCICSWFLCTVQKKSREREKREEGKEISCRGYKRTGKKESCVKVLVVLLQSKFL